MTRHDRDMLLRAADSVAKNDDLTGLAAIIRRVVERQPVTGVGGEPPTGTVRVRAAVAVCGPSDWAIRGESGFEDDTVAEDARDQLLHDYPSEAVHFIEADVPLPVSQTIQADIAAL